MDPHPARGRHGRPVAVLFAVAALLAATPQLARADEPPGVYEPPVDAPVVDPFRPAPHPYGAGNRGLEYALEPGTRVRAAALGEVVFAGPVAGSLHVTVLHPDGLRTTASYLESISVRRGDEVLRGDVVGTAGPGFHFGVRDGDRYLDPAGLFRRERRPARLVPVPEGGASAAVERAAIAGWLREEESGLLRRGLDWFEGRLAEIGEVAEPLAGGLGLLDPTSLFAEVARTARYALDEYPCTDPDVAPQPVTGRRRVVLVGGLGSTSEQAAVDDVDTRSLGYADADVYRFSYAGGRVPDPTDARQDLVANAYGSRDSQGDLDQAAGRLVALMDEIARSEPGVPVDVIAHSQGGVVTRLALDDLAASAHSSAVVENVITLGTPHGGADLATAAALVSTLEPTTARALDGLAGLIGTDLRSDSTAITQLAEGSPVIDELRRVAIPEGITLTSISARGDLVVPGPKSDLFGQPAVILPIDGATAHDDLPGSVLATREMGLALAGQPPTCESVADRFLDRAAGRAIEGLEDLLGPAVVVASPVPG